MLGRSELSFCHALPVEAVLPSRLSRRDLLALCSNLVLDLGDQLLDLVPLHMAVLPHPTRERLDVRASPLARERSHTPRELLH